MAIFWTALLDQVGALDSARQSGKMVYPVPEIMRPVPCVTPTGVGDLVEIRLWGRQRLAFPRSLPPFPCGVAPHDTLNGLLQPLDPALARNLLAVWGMEKRQDWVLDVVFHDRLHALITRTGQRPTCDSPASLAWRPMLKERVPDMHESGERPDGWQHRASWR